MFQSSNFMKRYLKIYNIEYSSKIISNIENKKKSKQSKKLNRLSIKKSEIAESENLDDNIFEESNEIPDNDLFTKLLSSNLNL